MAQTIEASKQQLELYSITALTSMLRARGAYQKQTAKSALVQALAAIVNDTENVRATLEKLSPEQKILLRVLGKQGGRCTISELKVASNALGNGDFDANLGELMRHALVLFETPGNTRHEIWRAIDKRNSNWKADENYDICGVESALELAAKFDELAAPSQELEPYSDEPYSVEEQAPTAVLHVLWSIVRWASEREITLTKTAGTFRKTDLKTLENQLKEQTNLRGFGLAVAFETGLLKRKRDKIGAASDATDFFARPPREQIEKLAQAWLQLSNWSEFFRIPEIETESQVVPPPATQRWGYASSDIPTTQELPLARSYLIGVLKRIGAPDLGQWQSLAALCDLIQTENSEFLIPRKNQTDYYGNSRVETAYRGFWAAGENRWKSAFARETDWHKVEGRFVRQVLSEPLSWLGLIAIGRDKNGAIVAFRLTPLGAHLLGLTDDFPDMGEHNADEKPLIIQPNFEILAFSDPQHLQTLYQLERFATREQSDRVAHYKLDRDSVYRGLQDGLNARQMREFLENYSRSGVPQNIAYSLDDWQSQWERISIRAMASTIESESEAEMDALLASFPADAATRLAPTWAHIEPRYLEAARTYIATKGARAFDYGIETEGAFSTDENLQIVVPIGNLDLWLRSKIEQFADELPATKTTARFQITRESLARAAKIGVKAERVLKFLASTGTPPIPANVALTLRGWGGEVKPVALGAMQVLVAAPEIIEQMAAIEELKSLLWLGGEGVVLVRSDDVAALRAQLGLRGIAFDGEAQTHLQAPQAARPQQQPRRLKPSHRGVEIGGPRRNKKTLVPAHPDESEVELQSGLNATETEELLRNALAQSRCVVIEYQSKVRLALRKINPTEIYEDGGNSYLGAYDHWRRAGRVFRVDRIARIAILDERFDAAQFG